MNCYIVIAHPQRNSDMEARIKSHYPERFHTIVEGSVWAIGTNELTCIDVSTSLGIVDSLPGIVVKAEEYYGMYDPGLWQRLSAWEGHKDAV